MITEQKFRLFSNDPNFRNISSKDYKNKQLAILKVYAGQKRIRRNDVLMDSIAKKNSQYSSKFVKPVDFLQSRTQSFEEKLINDIQELYEIKEQIKESYEERQRTEVGIDYTLRNIVQKAKKIDDIVKERELAEIQMIEKNIEQINGLYLKNKELSRENQEIAERIKQKEKYVTKKRKN